ncbi:MAG TPA: hypothetical protein VMF30_05910 [Pirellulales bacterium]|nr:hypothetical protein [Pirellulales bacterium]
MLVQQAVFSAGHRRQREGFHLVGRSAGLSRVDAQLLVRRLPWCDALSPPGRTAAAIGYFELSDEMVCVSRTMRLSGGPVSRGLGAGEGAQLLTHCLVVPRVLFAWFANDPFAILRAVSASGYVLAHEPAGGKLQPIRLAGRGPVVDHILLENLRRHPGARQMAALVHEAVENPRLILVGARAEELLSGLVSLLPVEERTNYSFSIGLRPSLRRPVRIVAVPECTLQIERFAQQCRYKVLKAGSLAKVEFHDDAWATVVEQALDDGNYALLAEHVAAGTEAETPSSGRQNRRAGERRSAVRTAAAHDGSWDANGHTAVMTADDGEHNDAKTVAEEPVGHQSIAARPARPAKGTPAPRAGAAERNRGRLHHDVAANDPAALAMLEQLDDLVYEAIAGRPGAFEELTEFWPSALEQLQGEALVESREQYVRYALGLWSQGDSGGIQDPQRAMGALDVLCLLFPEGEF